MLALVIWVGRVWAVMVVIVIEALLILRAGFSLLASASMAYHIGTVLGMGFLGLIIWLLGRRSSARWYH